MKRAVKQVYEQMEMINRELSKIYILEKNDSFFKFINILNEIKKILEEKLYSKSYDHYAEIIDGLSGSFLQLTKVKDTGEKKEIVNLCQDILQITLNNLREEKNIKKEIVFLPYKASMWDSLESIWKAAYKDKEHCNTYVMPIPYADRNPDQTVAQWHDEANLFPEYVPILDWRKTELKEMHPDIIFIHNPYDNCNSVTSVDSAYYSTNLKECTDLLVYVPYFVLGAIKPGIEKQEESIAHFITTLGVLNADVVVVQSEDMRQVYINVLIHHTNQKDRRYWEKHILGIGSPKYDKLLSTKKEDLQMPREWLKIIKKPDGSWKKVFFYNTGLTAFLKSREKMLDKIEDTFKLFRKNSDKVTLLWRPHPLILATLRSMLPQLLSRYKKLLNKYQKSHWGIYDDSPDLDRALILSDFYYGDPSSVIQLYLKTGKPIIYQSIMNDFERHRHTIPSVTLRNGLIITGDDIWLLSRDTLTLLHFSLSTKKLLDFFPVPEQLNVTSSAIAKVEDSIYIAPRNAESFWKFDIKNSNFQEIDIGLTSDEKKIYSKFLVMLQHNDCLYLFGCEVKGIIVYNTKTHAYKRINGYIDELLSKGISNIRLAYFYTLIDDTVYFAFDRINYILEFNFISFTYKIHQIGTNSNEHFYAMTNYENNLIITNENAEEIIWNEEAGILDRQRHLHIVAPQNYQVDWAQAFFYITIIKDTIIYVPQAHNCIYYRKINKNEINKIDLPFNISGMYNWPLYSCAFCLNDELYLQNVFEGIVYIFNPITADYHIEKFSIEDTNISKIIKNLAESSAKNENSLIMTNDAFLHNYIDSGVGKNLNENEHYENIGEKIFKTIINF